MQQSWWFAWSYRFFNVKMIQLLLLLSVHFSQAAVAASMTRTTIAAADATVCLNTRSIVE
jgi:hypothetical protein